MTKREDCPGSLHTGRDLGHIPGDGWPHNRHECPTCRGFYTPRQDGTLRRHKPHRGDNDFMAEKRAQLERMNRPGLVEDAMTDTPRSRTIDDLYRRGEVQVSDDEDAVGPGKVRITNGPNVIRWCDTYAEAHRRWKESFGFTA